MAGGIFEGHTADARPYQQDNHFLIGEGAPNALYAGMASDPRPPGTQNAMADSISSHLDQERRRRLSIGFNNFAHAVDHYVMLIFPTVVIGLEAVYGRPYSELLVIGTLSEFSRCRQGGSPTTGAAAT